MSTEKKHRGLTIRVVEKEHLTTTIIAYHEEWKVVEDEHKDVKNLRDREEGHKAGAINLSSYKDNVLKR